MSEARLATAVSEWRTTFDAMSDSVALLDSQHRFVRCNAATSEFTGVATADLVGRDCCELFRCGADDCGDCPERRARSSLKVESSIIHDGDRWLNVRFHPQTDDEGRFSGGVHTVSDITELKETEHALRESETRFRSLFEDAPTAMWEEDYSAVKPVLERLVAAGVQDIAGYLRAHPDEYQTCLGLARTVRRQSRRPEALRRG